MVSERTYLLIFLLLSAGLFSCGKEELSSTGGHTGMSFTVQMTGKPSAVPQRSKASSVPPPVVSDYVVNLLHPGRLSDWTLYSNTDAFEEISGHPGEGSLIGVSGKSSGSFGVFYGYRELWKDVLPGKTYLMEFWIRSGDSAVVENVWYCCDGADSYYGFLNRGDVIPDVWTRHTAVVTLPDSFSYRDAYIAFKFLSGSCQIQGIRVRAYVPQTETMTEKTSIQAFTFRMHNGKGDFRFTGRALERGGVFGIQYYWNTEYSKMYWPQAADSYPVGVYAVHSYSNSISYMTDGGCLLRNDAGRLDLQWQDDVVCANTSVSSDPGKPVPLVFSHILACLKQVNIRNDVADMAVVVSVRLTHGISSNAYEIGSGRWYGLNGVPVYPQDIYPDDAWYMKTSELPISNEMMRGVETTSICPNCLLIPGNWDLEIDYMLSDDNTPGILYRKVARVYFEPGVKTTVNVSLVADQKPIVFDVSLDSWQSGSQYIEF